MIAKYDLLSEKAKMSEEDSEFLRNLTKIQNKRNRPTSVAR